MNGQFAQNDMYEANLPVKYQTTATGPQHSNLFVSEFGASVYSSFEAMSSQIGEEHYSLYGNGEPAECVNKVGNENICTGDNVIAQRNYPCDNHVSYMYWKSLIRIGRRCNRGSFIY